MNVINPITVEFEHAARIAYLTEEYANAAADSQFLAEKINQLINWSRTQVRNLTSGMNQGNNGTLLPSA